MLLMYFDKDIQNHFNLPAVISDGSDNMPLVGISADVIVNCLWTKDPQASCFADSD